MYKHKKRSKIMTKESVNEATLQVVESLQEANKAVAETIVAAQQRNVKFAQSLFTSGVDILKSNAEGTQALLQELEQQAQKQQEAFQKLAQELGQDAKQELEQQIRRQQVSRMGAKGEADSTRC